MKPKRSKMLPNYLSLLLLANEQQLVKPGHAYDVEVRHDDDCAHWRGGACDCEVEVHFREINLPDVKVGGRDAH